MGESCFLCWPRTLTVMTTTLMTMVENRRVMTATRISSVGDVSNTSVRTTRHGQSDVSDTSVRTTFGQSRRLRYICQNNKTRTVRRLRHLCQNNIRTITTPLTPLSDQQDADNQMSRTPQSEPDADNHDVSRSCSCYLLPVNYCYRLLGVVST